MNKFIKNLPSDKKALAEKVLQLFHANGIDVMFMKLYSIDDDLDTVVIEKNQYRRAVALLRSNQWYLKNNKSKLRERDKDFFHHADIPYVIHLHQAFSWNTVTYLNSRILWERKRIVENLTIPSAEDEILIIGAHSLFENQYVKHEEVSYGKKLLGNNYDIAYMKAHAAFYYWEIGLNIIIDKLKKSEASISISELLRVKIIKLRHDLKAGIFCQFITEAFNYFVIDWIWNYRIMLQEKLTKHPVIITVSGVDGSGKTAAVKTLYQLFSRDLKQVRIVHPGNTPLIKKGEKNFLLPGFGYIIFIKDFLQIFFSIFVNNKYDVLIFDRYIYDTLVKITYKQKKRTLSKFLLSIINKLTPKPNLSFILKTSPSISYGRDKDHTIEYHQTKHFLYNELLLRIPNLINVETTGSKESVISTLETQIKPFLTSTTL